ncbi:MAG: hypothetical protein GY820_10410 [Gammaproteobacteria bacterium]|nr:hypothetical protein [Gammaproteobacteria bacterium]
MNKMTISDTIAAMCYQICTKQPPVEDITEMAKAMRLMSEADNISVGTKLLQLQIDSPASGIDEFGIPIPPKGFHS